MTKAQLKAYRGLKQEQEKLLERIKNWQAVKYSLHSPGADGMPQGSTVGTGGVPERWAVKMDEVERLYMEKAAALADALMEIEKVIDVLEPRERTLIRLYYFDGLTWEEVCVKMSYSWRQIHYIHKKALEKLRNV